MSGAPTGMLEHLIGQIAMGNMDEHFDAIYDAIKARREGVKNQATLMNKYTIRVGDTVRVTGGLRPASLTGANATVLEVKRTRFLVQPTTGNWGRFREPVTVPMSSVEKV